ncbi:MAG TPA: alkene reductase [Planctomycetaceae bacterium]|nr:alkene reductase [Planctomycetaceae bacterium]
MTTSTLENTETSTLQTPVRIGDVTLKNRVAMAPMTRARSDESRLANDLMVEYYRQRASAGLIISEAAVISDEARGWVNTPGIENDEQAESWRPVVDAVHEEGSKIFMQLWHMGRASHSSFHADGSLPVAPSGIKHRGEYIHAPGGKKPFEVPRELRTDEMARIVNDFRTAARRAKDAGFDGVEIHAANGYLLDTFLQSSTNHRTDEYGGSFENRFRLLREVLEAVIEVFGAGRVGVRLGPNTDYNDMGSEDFREAFLYYSKELDAYDLAYLHVIDGTTFGRHEFGNYLTLEEVRDVYRGTLMGNCGYDKRDAEAVIDDGQADLIAFGRPFITNPDLVERFANDWPLAAMPDASIWYSAGPEGYTDFPSYRESDWPQA